MNLEVAGIKYKKPQVTLLQESGIGVAEYAARTCYDSFENSENDIVKEIDYQLDSYMSQEHYSESYMGGLNNIESSELLHSLAWVHHHHSIIEHSTLSYLIKGTSRGVLQEHARHRIQAISVRSTRYTMSSVINAFIGVHLKYRYHGFGMATNLFFKKLIELDMFVIDDLEYLKLETYSIYTKLVYQVNKLGWDEFLKLSLSKENIEYILNIRDSEKIEYETIFNRLENGKKKRNVGDAFKHIVTDNWKVDMVVTFNLRSLKNYFDLRDSGAAYFQIQNLAEAMKEVTPKKYLRLIDKKEKK